MLTDNQIVFDRLLLKGKGVVETCLERDSIQCIVGFVDCQLAKGNDYVTVVRALREHIERQLQTGYNSERTNELLKEISQYISTELTTMHLDERLTLSTLV